MQASATVDAVGMGPVGRDGHGLLYRLGHAGGGQSTVRRHPVAVVCAAGAVGLLGAAEVAPAFLATAVTPGSFGRMVGPVTIFQPFRLAEVSSHAPDVVTYHLLWAAMLVVIGVSFVVPGTRLLAAAGLGLSGGLCLTLLSLRYSAAGGAHLLARNAVAAFDDNAANANLSFHITLEPGFYFAAAAVVLACVAVAWNSRTRQGERAPRWQALESGPTVEVTAS